MNRQALVESRQAVHEAAPAARILQRKCACGQHTIAGSECEGCLAKKRVLQRRATDGGIAEISSAAAVPGREAAFGAEFSAVPSHGYPTAGRPLEPAVAARYRAGLGPLVDRVRIHDDADGSETAARACAVAVTSGADIYFAADAYRPHSPSGRNLLAHELVHVWQQHRADGPPAGYRSQPGDRYEQEADRIAAKEAFARPSAMRAPAGAIRQRRTAAEQIATEIRNAVEGLGTDEQAIFNALAGRTPAEIAAIEAAYLVLSGGETLESRLRDELSGDDLSRAMSLLRGETAATEAARQIWNAVEGIGTDEESIYAAVAGRTAEQWQAIQDAYRQMAGEVLIGRLQEELTSGEFAHLQTLLPGAAGGAVTAEDRATVIANQIEAAVAGLGTDEEAIYSALTGHTQDELAEIGRRFRLLTGEDMNARLREELNDGEWARVQQQLHPSALPERIARELHDAMEGPGTHEAGIMAILTGRSPTELTNIRGEYDRLYTEKLDARLRSELSGAELAAALRLVQAGLLDPVDEIYLAVSGAGTDEERLFAVLRELSGDRARIRDAINSYQAKGYGDMLADIQGDLSGAELERAMQLLHGLTPSGTCSDPERDTGLLAISTGVSLAQNAVSALAADIAANRLSSAVSAALVANFNPGGAVNVITVGLAAQVRGVLDSARTDLLMVSDITCGSPAPCVAQPECKGTGTFTAGWTYSIPGATVRLCPAFFSCLTDDTPRGRIMLHEFVHHTGVTNAHEAYKGTPGFSSLKPLGDGSASDSLSHADTYASFALDMS
jgi:hypothetical protein